MRFIYFIFIFFLASCSSQHSARRGYIISDSSIKEPEIESVIEED